MYAIIEDGAHQYRVEEGTRLDVQLHDLAEDQKSIQFDKVLLVGEGADARVGQPYVDGASVTATIEGELKGDKIDIIKFRRRKNYRRKQGHRQRYLRVRVDKINA
ncbi:MAG: 50S ribosomal protein L21 [Phycisphaerales bacterium]|nr:50S ribosomal protein L21 [Phycisphaerales bacterium]